MKKLLLILIVSSFLFGAMAFAQEAELPNPGLTPDSSFYFLDTLGEKIGMFFAFSAKKKAEKALKYAGEKLAEVKAMAEQKEIKALEKANQKYKKFLELANQKTQDAKERGKDVEELATLITEKTLKHQEVLSEVFEKVPEEAKKGIEKAIEVSRRGSETAIQLVTGAKKEELQKKTVEIRTKNWSVYQNKKYGFEIKYPKGWKVMSQKYNPLSDLKYNLFLTNNKQLTLISLDTPNRKISEEEVIYTLTIWEQGNIAERYQENVHYELLRTVNNYDFVGVDDYRNPDKEIFGQILSTFRFIEINEANEEAPEVEGLEEKSSSAKAIESKENLVAIVNGVEITNDEFIQKLEIYILSNKAQFQQSGMGQRANETEAEFIQRLKPLVGKGILEQMITEIIIGQKAKEQNITVKPEEIDKKIDELKVTAQKLSESGMTIEELRQQIESQILMEKIVSKAVVVTEKEIRDYFESRKANFAKPEEIKVSHILLRTEIEAEVILSQLNVGADFAELASKESIDAITKDRAGDLGFFSRGKMTPAFEEAAFALEVGEISEVVKTPYGYHIIKVVEKKPAQEPNLELAREEILKTLTEQKAWTTRSNLLQNLRNEAQIEIIPPEFRD